MTEAEWLACEDPHPMLDYLRGPPTTVTDDFFGPHVPVEKYLEQRTSDRKLRLFACACCRRVWHLFTDERSRRAIEVAERFSDGGASGEELTAAESLAEEVVIAVRQSSPSSYGGNEALHVAAAAAYASVIRGSDVLHWLLSDEAVLGPDGLDSVGIAMGASKQVGLGLGFCPPAFLREKTATEWEPHARLLREFVGNPFRPIAFSPDWRTDTAIALAQQMYESRNFSAMPILADALQDAECDSEDILSHCRDPKPTHVRGCWVCDLVLGKS